VHTILYYVQLISFFDQALPIELPLLKHLDIILSKHPPAFFSLYSKPSDSLNVELDVPCQPPCPNIGDPAKTNGCCTDGEWYFITIVGIPRLEQLGAYDTANLPHGGLKCECKSRAGGAR
jgi:hypothetical protein